MMAWFSLIYFSEKFLSQFLFVFTSSCVKAQHGYRNLTGIDYSAASVELARNVLQAEDVTDVTLRVS